MIRIQLRRILGIAAAAAVVGCQTVPLTTQLQPSAIDYVLKRARFDMNCPTATASVLTSEVIQAPARALMINQGPERAQYTIGVTGCDQRQTFQVICAQGGDGCLVAR
jgi:hypothetical protein